MPKILLVEDEKILRDAYTILLRSHEAYEVTVVTNGREALDACKAQYFDVILLDLMMPVLDGVGFLENAQLEKTSPDTKVIVLSNLSSGDDIVRVLTLGAHHHAVKSDLAPNEVIALVEMVLQS